MKKIIHYLLYIPGIFCLLEYSSCNNNYVAPKQNPDDPSKLDWLIPKSAIINRGISQDSIPSLSSPAFVSPLQISLNDTDRIIGVDILGEFRVYPEKILAYHEVVNDVIKNKDIAVTYCPLTGTPMVFETTNVQGITPTLSATTYIYNSNHILYDDNSKSYFQQMYSKFVAGTFSGYPLSNFAVVETTWASWKTMFPSAKVLSPNTGYKFNYNVDPYSGYTSTDSLDFFTSPLDNRLPLKEKVLGLIVGDHAKVYRLSSFGDSVKVIQDNFQGLSVVLAGSRKRDFIVCYERRIANGPELDFSVNTEASNIIMEDSEGTKWDIFGNGVDGPRRGQILTPTNSMMGYWFAFGAMFPDALIYSSQ